MAGQGIGLPSAAAYPISRCSAQYGLRRILSRGSRSYFYRGVGWRSTIGDDNMLSSVEIVGWIV